MRKAFLPGILVAVFLLSGCGSSTSSPPPTVPMKPLNPTKPKTSPPPSEKREVIKEVLPINNKPANLPLFYVEASIDLLAAQLPPGATLGNKWTDSLDYNVHFNWAIKQSPETLRRELIRKFKLMVKIKASRGKPELATWYAKVCTTWASYGVDFGSPAANSPDFRVHESWALSPNVTPADIENQLVMRINKIFASYGY